MSTIQRTNCVTNPRAALDTKGWKSYNDYVIRVEGTPLLREDGTTGYAVTLLDDVPVYLPKDIETCFVVPGCPGGLPAISDRWPLPLDVYPGADYLFASCSAFVYGVDPHEVSFWASLKFYDEDDREISWMAFAHDEIAPLKHFELFEGLIKVPALAKTFHVFIKTDEVVQGQGIVGPTDLAPDLYFTQVLVENAYGRARLPWLYADGDSPGWTWDDTPHDSYSLKTHTTEQPILDPTETVVTIPEDAWVTLPPMTEDLFIGVIYGDAYCFYQGHTNGGGCVEYVPRSATIDWGDPFTATFTPTSGYLVTDVLLDGESIGVCTEKTWSAYTEDHVIEVSAEGVVTHNNYIAGAGGSIVGVAAQELTYGGDYGTEVTAVPDEGYVFVSWSDDSTKATRSDRDFLVDTDLTATFTLADPTVVTLTYSAGAGGTLTGTAVQEVTIGLSGTIVTAVPDFGYAFLKWSDEDVKARRIDREVETDITVEAQFIAVDTYTIDYTAGAHGSITGDLAQVVETGGSGTLVTATPDAGYKFLSWSDGSLLSNRRERGVALNLAFTASFVAMAPVEPSTYTLTYSAGVGGSISGVSTQSVAPGANGTRVVALPGSGYVFTGWSDDYPAASRIATGVHADLTATASFALIAHKLTYYTCRHADLTGTVKQTVSHGGSGTAVECVPHSGYHFVEWSDGVMTASRTDSNVLKSKYMRARVTRGVVS